MKTRIVPLALSISNAYLILGDRPVLVDAGSPGEEDQLVAALRQHGVTPADLSLAILTHGHTDHTGAVNALVRTDIPIAIGAQDADLLTRGANGPLPATGLAGTAIRPLVARMTFTGAEPQILITEPLRLDAYGVGATVVPVAGHTAGSCVVMLDGGDAIVGDLVRGGFAYGRIRPHHPLRHFFAEDVAGVRRALDHVLQHEPQRLYVGHGGPNVATADVRHHIDRIAPRR
ncbi:MAG: MBL fold metallo-hydrolase [Actinobacteria bacterium]|nr:MBL fold metallo-hydrolase [Actinomycetota bacterium]